MGEELKRTQALELARDLSLLKMTAGAIGLPATMHAIDDATKQVGREIEERYPR